MKVIKRRIEASPLCDIFIFCVQHFSGQYSAPELGNRRADRDCISHVFGNSISDASPARPSQNCIDCITVLWTRIRHP